MSEKAKKDLVTSHSDRSETFINAHRDEDLAVFPTVELAVVTPCYKELSSGNLGNVLATLSLLNVDKEKVAQIFVVNNPSIYAVIHRIAEKIGTRNVKAFLKALQVYTLSGGEEFSFTTPDGAIFNYAAVDLASKGKLAIDEFDFQNAIERFADAYKENLVTYLLIKQLEIDPKKTDSDQKIYAMRQIWQKYFPNLKLPSSFETAARRAVMVAAVDCFSEEKGFIERNIGLAKNIGYHLAFDHICPNCKYLHFSDGDTHKDENWVHNTLEYLMKNNVDVLVLQEKTINRSPPERMEELTLEAKFHFLVKYYGDMLVDRYSLYSEYAEYQGGSQILVSRRTFEKFEYPEGSINSDIRFARKLLNDRSLNVQFGPPSTAIYLSNRVRMESIDGGVRPDKDPRASSILDARKVLEMESVGTLLPDLLKFRTNITRGSESTKNLAKIAFQKCLEEDNRDRRVFLRRAKRLLQWIYSQKDTKPIEKIIDEQPLFIGGVADQIFDNKETIIIIIKYLDSIGVNNFEQAWHNLSLAFPNQFTEPSNVPFDLTTEINFIEGSGKLPPYRIPRDYFAIFRANGIIQAKIIFGENRAAKIEYND